MENFLAHLSFKDSHRTEGKGGDGKECIILSQIGMNGVMYILLQGDRHSNTLKLTVAIVETEAIRFVHKGIPGNFMAEEGHCALAIVGTNMHK